MSDCDNCGLPATIKQQTDNGDTICIRCQTDDNGNKLLNLPKQVGDATPDGETRDWTPQLNRAKAYNNGHPFNFYEELRRWW